MAEKVVTTSAPSKQETAAAKSYVGGAAKQFQGSAKVQEKVGGDARNVNYYKGSAAHSVTHPGSKYNNYEQNQYMDLVRQDVHKQQIYAGYDYLRSGNLDDQSTSEWLNTANANAQTAKDEGIRGLWMQLANDIEYTDNRFKYGNLDKEKQALQTEQDKLKTNRANTAKAASAGMQSGNFLGDYADTIKQIRLNDDRLSEINAAQQALDEAMILRFAPDDVRADYEALKSGKLHGTTLPDLSGMHNPGEDAQARVDEWMQSFGLNQAYLNRFDRAVGGARSAGNSIAGGLEGAVSIVGKALNSADTSDMNVMGAASFTGTTQKNKEDREARKERIGLPEGQATEDYLAWQNNERYGQGNIDLLDRNTDLYDEDGKLMTVDSIGIEEDGKQIVIPTVVNQNGKWVHLSKDDAIDWYHKTGEYLGKFNTISEANAYAEQLHQRQDQIYGGDGNAYEIENAQRLEALLQPEIDKLGEQIYRLETNHTKASQATSVAANHAALDASLREDKEIRQLKNQRQDMIDRLLEAQGLRDKTSLRYKLATDYQNDIFAKLDASVDSLDAQSQAEILKAKERATSYGKILLDMEKTGLEMGFDMAVGMVTGGSSLAPMFIRVLGNESAAARREGATLDQQLAYGLTKASIEFATEKLFGAFDKIGYGKGIASEMSELIVAKLAETPLGRTIVRAIISAVEEGAEEGLADILAPIADQLYKDETWKESWDRNTENFWYDVLLGAAMGGIGFAGGIVTGQNAQANANLYVGEAEAMKYGTDADVQAVLDQAGNVPQSDAYKVLAKVQKIKQQIEADHPITESLSREEAAIARSMGLIDKETAKILQEPSERQKAKAKEMVEKSTSKSGQRRETIIKNAIKEGVKTKSDRIREEVVEDEDADMLPPMLEGPQSSKEGIAQERAKAEEQKAAIDAGETDNKPLVDVVKDVDSFVTYGKTLATISKDAFADGTDRPLSKKVWSWIKKNFGEKVYSEKLSSDVIINERGIKNDISHGVGKSKAMTFQAVPAVIKRGDIVSKTTSEVGELKSVVVAGKVNLNNKPVNVYCLLKSDDSGQNRFYLHEVSDGKGNLFYQLNDAEAQEEGAASALQDSTLTNQGSAEETPSSEIIPQEASETQEKTEPQETLQNAPETQAAEESTPVAPAEEKAVKPDVKSSEQAPESKAVDPRSEALKIIQESVVNGEVAKEAAREKVRELVPEWDDAKFDRLWDYSKPYSKPEKSEPELKREETQDAIEVALSFVENGANPFRGQPVTVKPDTLKYMKTASVNNPIVIGKDSEHAYIFDGTFSCR